MHIWMETCFKHTFPWQLSKLSLFSLLIRDCVNRSKAPEEASKWTLSQKSRTTCRAQFAWQQLKTWPTSASAVVVQVMLSRTLGDAFPMMQGGPWGAAHALGVVRETGGTGRVAGCGRQRVNVNGLWSGDKMQLCSI